MKVSIFKVERNMFQDEKGKEVRYCKFSVLKAVESTADVCGCDVVSYTTKYENFDKVVQFYKMNKPVEVTLEYKQVLKTGLYKECVSQIEDVKL